MDIDQARALARIEESQPDYTTAVLHDSGFGDLADQWVDATDEFQAVAKQPRAWGAQEQEVSTPVVRAYARMCVCWSRITQLRDQALASVERLAHQN